MEAVIISFRETIITVDGSPSFGGEVMQMYITLSELLAFGMFVIALTALLTSKR